jgi:hypothetical protein
MPTKKVKIFVFPTSFPAMYNLTSGRYFREKEWFRIVLEYFVFKCMKFLWCIVSRNAIVVEFDQVSNVCVRAICDYNRHIVFSWVNDVAS